MKRLHSLQFVLIAIAAASPLAAQSVSVTATNPNSAAQGTINLNVTISGKGFKNGAHSHFFVSGTTNSGGVTVNATTFTNSTQLVANIDVDSAAQVRDPVLEIDELVPPGERADETERITRQPARNQSQLE